MPLPANLALSPKTLSAVSIIALLSACGGSSTNSSFATQFGEEIGQDEANSILAQLADDNAVVAYSDLTTFNNFAVPIVTDLLTNADYTAQSDLPSGGTASFVGGMIMPSDPDFDETGASGAMNLTVNFTNQEISGTARDFYRLDTLEALDGTLSINAQFDPTITDPNILDRIDGSITGTLTQGDSFSEYDIDNIQSGFLGDEGKILFGNANGAVRYNDEVLGGSDIEFLLVQE